MHLANRFLLAVFAFTMCSCAASTPAQGDATAAEPSEEAPDTSASLCPDGASCFESAEAARKAGNSEGALELYQAGCDLDDARACSGLGVELSSTDPAGSERAYRKSCTLKHALGCANLAALLYGRDEIDDAKSLFEQACELGDTVSCTNSGVFAQQAKQWERATRFFYRSCGAGDGPACVSWKTSAEELCRAPDPSACIKTARSYQSENNQTDAGFLLKVACEAGHAPSCAEAKK
ncbi:MAG: hypothetical protein AAF658_03770 [Myxococcota bacterium]